VGELKHELFQARKRKAPKHEIDDIKHRLRNAKIVKYQQKKQSGSKHHDYPVRLVDDNVLRLRWNAIKPNIEKTLEYFAGYTQLEIDIHINSDSTGDLKGQVLEDMILDRVVKGDKMDAITLVKKHYGFSTTDSIKFIGELMDNVSNLESDK
jgi:hypothetical protein